VRWAFCGKTGKTSIALHGSHAILDISRLWAAYHREDRESTSPTLEKVTFRKFEKWNRCSIEAGTSETLEEILDHCSTSNFLLNNRQTKLIPSSERRRVQVLGVRREERG
jgi:hypothetical protein